MLRELPQGKKNGFFVVFSGISPAAWEASEDATRANRGMTKQEKQALSEIDICDLFITPAIKGAGWDQHTQIRREVTLAPGPVIVRGNMSSRNKKKRKFADYVLLREAGVPIAIVEAKDNNHTVSHGMQQALGYAGNCGPHPPLGSLCNTGFHGEAVANAIETDSQLPAHCPCALHWQGSN